MLPVTKGLVFVSLGLRRTSFGGQKYCVGTACSMRQIGVVAAVPSYPAGNRDRLSAALHCGTTTIPISLEGVTALCSFSRGV
eukprot:6203128-Pleurochrysis_carterae.AAC.6